MAGSISRRGFIRLVAATAGLASVSGTVSANDSDFFQGDIIDYSPGANGIRYLYGRISDHFSGSDSEALQEAQNDQFANRIEDLAVEIRRGDSDVAAAYLNLSDGYRTYLFNQAMPQVIQGLDEGKSRDTIVSEAESFVQERRATSAQNLADRMNITANRIETWFSEYESRGMDVSQDFSAETTTITDPYSGAVTGYVGTGSKVLGAPGGPEFNYPTVSVAGQNDITGGDGSGAPGNIYFRDIKVWNHDLQSQVWGKFYNATLGAENEISTFVDSVIDDYQEGDVNTGDLVESVGTIGMSSDQEETPLASSALTSMGIPTNEGMQLTIELLGNEQLLDGRLFLSEGIDGSISVGQTYRPADVDGDGEPIDGLIYFAVRQNGEETLVRIQQPFTVVDGVDSDGNSLDELNFSDPPDPERVDYNTSAIIDRIEEIEQRRLENEEEVRQAASAGGFDWSSLSFGGLPGEAVALGVGALGVILYGGSGGSS